MFGCAMRPMFFETAFETGCSRLIFLNYTSIQLLFPKIMLPIETDLMCAYFVCWQMLFTAGRSSDNANKNGDHKHIL